MEEDESVGAWSSFWTQVSSCLPCTSRRWRSDDSGADAPILHPPTGNLAECLIPPCAPGLYGESSSDDLPSTKDNIARKDLHAGDWALQAVASRGRSPRKGRQKDPDSSIAEDTLEKQAIELKEADSNPLLGQFHLENKGQFLKDKWATPPLQGFKDSLAHPEEKPEELPPILDIDDSSSAFDDPILADLT